MAATDRAGLKDGIQRSATRVWEALDTENRRSAKALAAAAHRAYAAAQAGEQAAAVMNGSGAISRVALEQLAVAMESAQQTVGQGWAARMRSSIFSKRVHATRKNFQEVEGEILSCISMYEGAINSDRTADALQQMLNESERRIKSELSSRISASEEKLGNLMEEERSVAAEHMSQEAEAAVQSMQRFVQNGVIPTLGAAERAMSNALNASNNHSEALTAEAHSVLGAAERAMASFSESLPQRDMQKLHLQDTTNSVITAQTADPSATTVTQESGRLRDDSVQEIQRQVVSDNVQRGQQDAASLTAREMQLDQLGLSDLPRQLLSRAHEQARRSLHRASVETVDSLANHAIFDPSCARIVAWGETSSSALPVTSRSDGPHIRGMRDGAPDAEGVDEAFASAVALALRLCAHVKVLDFDATPFEDFPSEVRSLYESIMAGTPVDTASFSGTLRVWHKARQQLREDLLKLFAALIDRTREIRLRDNMLTDRDIHGLSSSVSNSTTLEVLDLSGNKITDHGAERLSMAAVQCQRLKRIDLSWNCISEQMCSQLRHNLQGLNSVNVGMQQR